MITFQGTAQFDRGASVLLLEKSHIKQKKFHKNISEDLKQRILEASESGAFSGNRGELFPLIYDGNMVVLAGIGSIREISSTQYRILVKGAVQAIFLKDRKSIEIVPYEPKDEHIQSIIEAILLGTYRWEKYISEGNNGSDSVEREYTIVSGKKKLYENAIAICEGANLTRDLVNDNADVVTATYLEKTIKKLVKGKKNISLNVIDKKEMKAIGLNLHLAVNQGSRQDPKLIIVKYNGAAKKSGYTALIGKGITFDTGGLNLKPSGHIENMRFDMGGAAAVIGVLKNAIALNLKKNILFVCGIAENVTGAHSYKPGDVIKSYSGKTVEVANTDAEGRLVLADAISYVVKNYKPSKIVDIATLTGACIVALGFDYSALVSTDDQFARNLIQSSNETDDRVWRLPCYAELKDTVKSQVADIRNLGTPKGAAGTLTAAEFLRQFTEDTKWAHLDIAGSAFVENSKRLYFGHGATGAGVRLLTHYVQHH